MKPHNSSYSCDLGRKIQTIAIQTYDKRADNPGEEDFDEEPLAAPFDPMLPGKKKLEKRIIVTETPRTSSPLKRQRTSLIKRVPSYRR